MSRLPIRYAGLLATASLFAGCDKSEDAGARGSTKGQNLLLITLDTTRADHLGCYGDRNARTPAIDALASRGMVFEDAQAQVPLTLPSHCTIMTGRYPREFGVRNNNQKAIGTTHPTLASIFRQHGYRTAAFVASFVLDSRFGLDRGFDVYDDEMGNKSLDVQPLDWEQPANVIADHALTWLEAGKNQPFFCWVHFYDPHDPHRPPEGFPPTYDGEIAFMDTQIKRISDWLDASGQKDRTLLIVVGDHGESFGEHGEEGHGAYLYQATLHVPLLFVHPLAAGGKRVPGPVGIIDIFPTVLDLFGLPKPDGLLSSSFAMTMLSGTMTPRDVFSESNYALESYGWAEQRSLATDQWKYISSTKPELFDRKVDRDEKNNLLDTKRNVAAEPANKLFDLYKAMVPSAAVDVQHDEKARQALEAIGYVKGVVGTTDAFLTPGLPDPKDKMHLVKQFTAARRFITKEQFDLAIPLLESAVAEAPEALAFQGALGNCLVRVKKYEEALAPLGQALKLDPYFQPALIFKAEALLNLGDLQGAFVLNNAAALNDPNDPTAQVKLADTLVKLSRDEEAIRHYRKAIELFPDIPEAHSGLASVLSKKGDADGAAREYREAIRLKSGDLEANYNLGVVLAGEGKFDEAVEQFRQVVKMSADHGDAWINLGICLLRLGKNDEGKESLRHAAQIQAAAPEAYYNLGLAAFKENDLKQSAELFEKVVNLNPTHWSALEGLSRSYLGEQRFADALRVLRLGVANEPSNKSDPAYIRIVNLLANVLATATDDGIRNGEEALRLAKQVAEQTHSRHPAVLQTLAAAYAETGDFKNAIATAEKALETLSPNGGAGGLKDSITRQIVEYRAGRPIRQQQF
jgi:arylsulfatase A-like enzyme/Flp pilus assembly protein TadD